MVLDPVDIRIKLIAEVSPGNINKVSSARRDYISRFRRDEDKRRALAASLLLDEMLFERLGLHEAEVTIARAAHGKPFLPDYPDVHFNVSHSGDYAVCAMAPYEVGIDVQRLTAFSRGTAEFFMSDVEIERVAQLTERERDREFTRLWTRFEAVAKLTGQGLAHLRSDEEQMPSNRNIIVVDRPLDDLHHLSYAYRDCPKQSLDRSCRDC